MSALDASAAKAVPGSTTQPGLWEPLAPGAFAVRGAAYVGGVDISSASTA